MKQVFKFCFAESPRLPISLRTAPLSPTPSKTLIKVLASSINPSDIAYVSGLYPLAPPLPNRVGFFGAGEVLTGPLQGKNAAFRTHGGAWAEYVEVNSSDLLVTDMLPTEAQGLLLNPLTAVALLDRLAKAGKKRVVVDAACSSLGFAMNSLTSLTGITMINLVRNQAQVERMSSKGWSSFALDSPEVSADLSKFVKDFEGDSFVSLVGGVLSEKVIKGLLPGSLVLIVGALSLRATQLPIDFIFYEKTVEAFHLSNYLKAEGEKEKKRLENFLREHEQLFKETAQKTFSLEEVNEAIQAAKTNRSLGKILLVPT